MDRETNKGKKIMKKIILILTLLFITTIIVNYAYACVDCDLNKKAFEKDIKVVSVEGDIDTINYDKVTEIYFSCFRFFGYF